MSEQTYTPRSGSKAEAAIEALKANTWMSVAQLAEEIDVDQAAVHGYVQTAINHGAVRKVARDGKAGFMLGGSDAPPQDDEAEQVTRGKQMKAKKPAPAPKRARTAPQDTAPAPHPLNGTQAVGILEDGTIVIIDEQGHALSLPASTARRVAELVSRTA